MRVIKTLQKESILNRRYHVEKWRDLMTANRRILNEQYESNSDTCVMIVQDFVIQNLHVVENAQKTSKKIKSSWKSVRRFFDSDLALEFGKVGKDWNHRYIMNSRHLV